MNFPKPDRNEAGPVLLSIMRILMGWTMLWAFFDKMFGLGFQTPAGSGYIDGGSPSAFVTYLTSGIFSDIFTHVAGNPVVDILLLAGCLGLGISLMLGLASKLSTVLMCIFLLFMYCIVVPPQDNPLIDYHLVYIVAMLAIYWCGGFEKFSLYAKWKGLRIVKRFPILE